MTKNPAPTVLLTGFAPCAWISNGRPIPAVITGNAANALPMITVNRTMPSP